MSSNGPDLGEQALSKVAEVGISSQLDEVEELNVDIRSNPLKMMQGEVDSVAISGKGMVVNQDLRMEEMEIKTNSVAIDPMKAMFGNLELTQPTDAEARIVLTESDLNRAFNSDFLRPKLRNLKMQMNGQPITVDIQQAQIQLPGEGKLALEAKFLVQETSEVKEIASVVVPKLIQNEQRIDLDILATESDGLTVDLATAVLEHLTTLLDLKNFEIPGMSLQLKQFDVQQGQILMFANTRIEEIPSE